MQMYRGKNSPKPLVVSDFIPIPVISIMYMVYAHAVCGIPRLLLRLKCRLPRVC